MYEFLRTVNLALALCLGSACGANIPPDSQPENPQAAPATPPEPAAEADEVEGDPASTAEADTGEQQGGSDAKSADEAKGESGWSPETSETILDRGRSRLKRRCDRHSQAACDAIPDLDGCLNLKLRSCARLGDLFARGAAGVDPNPAHARDFWWRACDIAPAECVKYGKLLFDMEGLEARQAVADRFFQMGCTNDYKLCESVGRFYQEKSELGAAKKFFELGCNGGQQKACEAKAATAR
jgi:hypothetical protein